MNFFAKIGKEIEMWNDSDWHEFNQWKLIKLEEMYASLSAVENKADNAIDELEQLKKVIDLVKEQIHPKNDPSISPGE